MPVEGIMARSNYRRKEYNKEETKPVEETKKEETKKEETKTTRRKKPAEVKETKPKKFGRVIADELLNVRSSNYLNGNNVITQIKRGSTVTILDDSIPGWYHVETEPVKGKTTVGYVVAKYIEEI